MVPGTLLFIFSLAAKIKAEQNGVFFKIEENSFLFHGNAIWNGKAESLLSCSQMCAMRADCKSANFIAIEESCLLLSEGQTKQGEKLLKRDGSLYLEKVCSLHFSWLQNIFIFADFNVMGNKYIIHILNFSFSKSSSRLRKSTCNECK